MKHRVERRNATYDPGYKEEVCNRLARLHIERFEMKKLLVQNTPVSISRINEDDYISLTDIARERNPDEPRDVVKNWLRNRSTIEFLGLWEKINNPGCKGVEFDSFRLQAGSNSFTLSLNKWIETTMASAGTE